MPVGYVSICSSEFIFKPRIALLFLYTPCRNELFSTANFFNLIHYGNIYYFILNICISIKIEISRCWLMQVPWDISERNNPFCNYIG